MNIGSTHEPAEGLPTLLADSCPNEGDQLAGQQSPPPPDLVKATREEVVRITREIAALSKKPLGAEAYFVEFLQRVTTALASVGGAVWTVDDQGVPRPMAQINWHTVTSSDTQELHPQLLDRALALGRPSARPPGSSSSPLDVANPTEYLLLLAPLRVEDKVVGLVEVFQRPHRGPATERGYLAFLVEMSELAGSYMRNEQLRRLSQHREWSEQLERFLAEVHRHLDVEGTAYSVVNEARRLTGVDRVSLAIGEGRRCHLKVVSGLDSIDRRADQVQQLARLSGRVMKGREPAWLETHQVDLPPQIEKDWNRYIDISHVRRCVILPLLPPESRDACGDSGSPFRGTPFGALIFEQLREAIPNPRQDRRIVQLSRHGAAALHNALEHEKLFLLPLWRALGGLCDALGGRHFAKTLLATIVFVAGAVALTTFQSEFSVPVRGKMQPVLRRTVFAPQDGVVTQVNVDHGELVQAGQILMEMRNTDLEVEITSLWLAGKLPPASRSCPCNVRCSKIGNWTCRNKIGSTANCCN